MRGLRFCAAAVAAGMLGACQTPPSHEQLVAEQLDAIVEAQAPECVAVRMHRRTQRLDYEVVCQSGSVYRVRVQPDGRVTVTPDETAAAPPAPR